jgi:triacylglycerol lipase
MGGNNVRFVPAIGSAVVALLVTVLSTSAAFADEVRREPVILVHGWAGSTADMSALQDAFTAAGYPAYTVDLPGQNNVVNAHAIADLVHSVRARTGAAKVHLVGHSMGGLSMRWYIKRLGGAGEVRTYVSMGSPQYGYLPACLLGEQDGGQMCPFNPFLRDLDEGDDTPGVVAYTTIRSTKDTADVTRLDGGACFHEIADVEHVDEPRSIPFIAAALTAVGGTCPGTFTELPST